MCVRLEFSIYLGEERDGHPALQDIDNTGRSERLIDLQGRHHQKDANR